MNEVLLDDIGDANASLPNKLSPPLKPVLNLLVLLEGNNNPSLVTNKRFVNE